MFIGHYGVALAAKRTAPNLSLGTLVLASLFLDMLFPLLLLVGFEHVRIQPGITAVNPLDLYDYPYSHSLLAALVWSIVCGVVYYRIRLSKRGGLAVGILVALHWVLDYVSHRPDLQLAPGIDVRIGLGLWNHQIASVIAEGGIFAAGTALYVRSTDARDRIGIYAFWPFILMLAALYVASLTGPPPPNVTVLAFSSLLQWLFVAWAYWISAHRQAAVH